MHLQQLVIKMQVNSANKVFRIKKAPSKIGTLFFACENALKKVIPTFLDAVSQQRKVRGM